MSSVSAAPAARLRRIALPAVAATAYSLNTVFARLALAGGADVATINAARFLFIVVLLFGLSHGSRGAPSLSRKKRGSALLLGLPFSLTSLGYLASLRYIPVSIAVLVLYTYPILVGLLAGASGGEGVSPRRLAALLLAFLGLALAMNVDIAALPDWRGVALAFMAAAAMSVFVIGSARLLNGEARPEVNFHLMLGATVPVLALLPLGGGPHWPVAAAGWWSLASVLVTFSLAQLALLAAIGRAGAVLTAAVMNLEPVVTIALAVLLVGERLSLSMSLGAALVALAIFLADEPRKAAVLLAEP